MWQTVPVTCTQSKGRSIVGVSSSKYSCIVPLNFVILNLQKGTGMRVSIGPLSLFFMGTLR